MASIRKRGNNFTVTVSMGYDQNGKQIKKTTTYKPPEGVTDKKAEKLANEYAVIWEQKINGYVSLDENRTLRELIEWFLETAAPHKWRETTLHVNTGFLNRYVLPRIGNRKLKEITPSLLDRYFAELQKTGRTGYVKKDEPLSANTVGRTRQLINSIFSEAVRKEIMVRNPCRLTTLVGLPSNGYKAESFLDSTQAKSLLKALEDCDFQFKVIITLLLYSGARVGEICALRLSSVDFENNVIYINKTLTYIPDKGYSLEPPKTKNSTRYIALPQNVMDLLKKHFETRIVLNPELEEMCFHAPEGGYCHIWGINRTFKNLAKKLGLPDDIHTHSLRHTATSIMINSDIPTRVISEQLGHANTVITENTYGHVFAESKVKAMKAIETSLNLE